MLLLLPYTEYLRRIVEPRNIADIFFVFLLVYGVLKLLRGTRAAAHGRRHCRPRFPLLAFRQTRSGNAGVRS